MRRRDAIKGVGAGIASPAFASLASAQGAAAYPSKPITFILPWGAGTPLDLFYRALCESAGRIFGQPVVVENKAGGSGTAAPAAMAATAKPDGYTICHVPGTLLRMPFIQKVSYDPLKDFTWIMNLSGYLLGTYATSDSPFKSMADLIAFGRANPGKLVYGTPGAGSTPHVGMEQISRSAGVTWTHVPFVQGLDANLLGGHIMAAANTASWWPHTDAGKMRELAVWSEGRNPRLPEVPNLKELGIPLVVDNAFGIAGPRGMEPALVQKIHDVFKQALDDPKVHDLKKRYDLLDRYMDTQAYARSIVEQVVEQKELVERLGLAKKG